MKGAVGKASSSAKHAAPSAADAMCARCARRSDGVSCARRANSACRHDAVAAHGTCVQGQHDECCLVAAATRDLTVHAAGTERGATSHALLALHFPSLARLPALCPHSAHVTDNMKLNKRMIPVL